MAIRTNNSIDIKIVDMRKDKCRILTIHKWLVEWDYFSQLDEQIVLCHILRVLDENSIAVSRNEVRTCFNKFYNKNYHGDKKTYLSMMYHDFGVKIGTVVDTSQIRVVTTQKPSFSPIKLRQRSPVLHENEQSVEILTKSKKEAKNDLFD